MTTTIEYALMAGASYIDTRDPINRFPTPQNWVNFNHQSLDSGFEAVSFVNGTDIVISYAGTNPNSLLDPDNAANIGLATGLGSAQLTQAADYYLAVKAANSNANITFTGHSLGGGLAALMGVFFGRQAVTFDQAPFANSAQDNSLLSNPLNLFTPDVAADLRQYLSEKTLTDPAQATARNVLVANLNGFLLLRQANGGIPNSNLVSTIRVDGEFTSSLPVGIYDPIGTPATVLDHGPYFSPSIDMHSQSLLTTFLQSQQTAASSGNPQQTLSEVTKKLTDLLKMIFDKNLFARDTDKGDPNLLEHLIRHEAGNAPGVTTADAMVTRFTADLWQIAQDGGLTMSDKNLSDALTAFAMQMYYEDTANVTDPDKHLFDSTGVSGGLHFDRNDVAATLADAKGYTRYFVNYLATLLPTERLFITQQLPDLRDWYIQAGRDALNATAGTQRASFMFGGTGDAAPTGNDLLIGGAGRDIYLFNQGYGIDRIYDDDDSGPEKSILFLGAGVDKDAIKLRKGSLLIDLGNGDQIHIADFDANDPLANPTFDTFQFADGVTFTWNDLLAKGFDLDGSEADDTLIGSGVEDRIDGKGGNDWLWRLRDTGKTRRWQHGDKRTHTSSNDAHWRIAA